MPFWKRSRPSTDRISSEQLARFGRYLFLESKLNGSHTQDSFSMVSDLASATWVASPEAHTQVIAELRRHAAKGSWEKVGAWKFVREFLDDAPDTADLIDGGLLTIASMRVTNLAINLAPIDTPRYEELTAGPVPNDGFFGPPVFDSNFGPTRQDYLNSAVAAASKRSISRIAHQPGVRPGPIADAARSMWDFGLLIYRGPVVVNPEIIYEPKVVGPAVAAATGVDHTIFMERVTEAVLDPANRLNNYAWASIGGARFAEEYLCPQAIGTDAYRLLLDSGLNHLVRAGEPGLMVAPDLLTPIQRERLREIRAGR